METGQRHCICWEALPGQCSQDATDKLCPQLLLQAVVRGHQARQAQRSTVVLQPILAKAIVCRDELVASRSAL